MINKTDRKLECWKDHTLSRRGRLRLINYIITALPIYYMPLFILPQLVIQHRDCIQRAFSGKGDKEVHGSGCLMNWSKVCSPKTHGGLGTRDVRSFNTALIAKWRWHFLQKCTSLWVLLVRFNYDRRKVYPDPLHSFVEFSKLQGCL